MKKKCNSIEIPSIYERVRALASMMPCTLGYRYMQLLNVEFGGLAGSSMEFVLQVHPFTFRTYGIIPASSTSQDSLASVVKDHLYKLDVQIHEFFNEKNGQFWLKPEHQHMTYKEPAETGVQSIAQQTQPQTQEQPV